MEHKILYFPVGQIARVLNINDEQLDNIAQSDLRMEMPFLDNVVVAMGNDRRLPLNRVLLDEDRNALGAVHGDFLMVGVIDGTAVGLTDDQIEHYRRRHLRPTGLFDLFGKRTYFAYDPIDHFDEEQ